MKVVLLADVPSQGKKGDLIDVSDGYARNFLFPKKLAQKADAKVLNDIAGQEKARLHRIEVEKAAAAETAEKLKTVTVKVSAIAGAGENSKLYGAVTSKEIASALESQFGIVIDRRRIDLSEPIKAFGAYRVPVKLYTDISGTINLIVKEG
ncbi:MAG: 50S ribosomal protein L9 [Clostridia bacterium]|nr:50S ribosomal protein L9 [Clostridia bacterium]